MKHFSFVYTLLVVALLAGCESVEFSSEPGRAGGSRPTILTPPGPGLVGEPNAVHVRTEQAYGASLATSTFASQGRLYENDGVQRYVNLVGKSLASYTSRPNVDYRFAVVSSSEVNAWSTPGGYVFITTGALANMQDEAMLAGVLAHEMAHISQYHMLTMLRGSNLLPSPSDFESGESAFFRRAVNTGSDILFTRGYDRQMEYDADLAGMEIAAAAGYDPSGLARFLSRISLSSGPRTGWHSSAHPSSVDRAERLNRARSQDYEGIQGATVETRFKNTIPQNLR